MHVVEANARMIIRMFHVALLSQRRIAREHNGANQIGSDNGVANGDDDDGVHVLGIDDGGEYLALIQSVYVCIATKSVFNRPRCGDKKWLTCGGVTCTIPTSTIFKYCCRYSIGPAYCIRSWKW